MFKYNLTNKVTPAGVLVALILFGYISVVYVFFRVDAIALHSTWIDSDGLNHGYAALLIACYLTIRNAKNVIFTSQPNYFFSVPLLALSIIYCLGYIVDIAAIRYVSILIFLPCTLGLIGGKDLAKAAIIPAGIMFFSTPTTYIVLTTLQDLTVAVVTFFVRLSDLTAYIDGPYIHIAEGVIWVREGCSGHKYFVTGCTLALTLVALNNSSTRQAITIITVLLTTSLFANWLRVYLLVIVGYTQGIDHPLMHDHDNFGWLVFGIIFMPALIYLNTARRNDSPKEINSYEWSAITSRKPLPTLILALTIIALPFYIIKSISGNKSFEQTIAGSIKAQQLQTQENYRRIWFPDYIQPAEKYDAGIGYKNKNIWLSIWSYESSEPSSGLHARDNKIIPGTWKEISKSRNKLTINGKTVPHELVTATAPDNRTYLVFYWHELNGSHFTKGLDGRLTELNALFSTNNTRTLFSFAIRCSISCENEYSTLKEFITNHADYLQLNKN